MLNLSAIINAMYRKARKNNEIAIGIIRIHSRGFGFLIPDDKELFPNDIFIPRHSTKGAVDGDMVEVAVNIQCISEKGPEGSVIKILKRSRTHLAGIITYVGKKNQIFAYAPLLGEEQSIHILPSKEKDLQPGDRVIIHVLDWGGKKNQCLGEVSSFIGHISDPSCDIISAIQEFNIRDSFPENTLLEAKAYGRQVSAQDLVGREDLRSLDCFTIDPDTAKDFDDALSLSRDKEGNYYLGVHIADVTHYVKEGSALDQEAAIRCNSVYFPGTVIPMLPHELSSHLCSLKPQVNRLAVSVLLTIDHEGTLQNYRICRSVIKSKKRFTYREAKEVLDGLKKSRFSSELAMMTELCHLLKKKRYERGSIEFALPDLSVELTTEGAVKKIDLVEYDITHQLVEEFMLLANEIIATHLSTEGKPLTFRIHEEPNPENMRDFAMTASALGFKLSEIPSTEELQTLFDEARQTAFGQFLATAFIRSMKLASYSTQNIGHYGLGLEHYTHFTSPIRRYIDLLVHRVLFNEVEKETDLEDIALRCSEKERLSSKAESSVINLKKLRYLEAAQKNGIDTYNAVVIAVKQFGCLFELKEMMFEGFLHQMEKHLVVGSKIIVQLKSIDLITRQTEWVLLFPIPQISERKVEKKERKMGFKGGFKRRKKEKRRLKR